MCLRSESDLHTFSVNYMQKETQNIQFSPKNHLSFLTHEAYNSK